MPNLFTIAIYGDMFVTAARDMLLEFAGPIGLVLTGITLGLIAWFKGRKPR